MFPAIARALRGEKCVDLRVRNIGKETKWTPFAHPHTETYFRDWWTPHLPRVGDVLVFAADKRKTSLDMYMYIIVKEVRFFDDGRAPHVIADFASPLPCTGHEMRLCGFSVHSHDGANREITGIDPFQYPRYQVQTAA